MIHNNTTSEVEAALVHTPPQNKVASHNTQQQSFPM